MPKVMKQKCFLLFFAVFVIAEAQADFDYYDCGSSFNIKTVSVTDCNRSPCPASIGNNLTVEITLSEVTNLNKTEMEAEAFLWMYGSKWPMEVNPANPCTQWHCPVLAMNNLDYIADIIIPDNFIRRPANIELEITYDNGGQSVTAVCIEFAVDLQ